MLENVLLVISVLLIAIVLIQGRKSTDGGQVITGTSALFQNTKERGFDLFISRATLVLGITFFIISFILFIQ